MKKTIFYFGIVLLLLASCKKEQSEAHDVEKVHLSPEELKQQLEDALGSGSRSWEAILNPRNGKTYSMFLNLLVEGKVKSLIDLSVETARTIKEGSYSLSMNVSHASINFSKGTYFDMITHKEGFKTVSADTSYAFQYQNGDTLVFRGNVNGDELFLVDLKANEVAPYENYMFGNAFIYLFNYFSKARFYSFISEEGFPVQIVLNQAARTIRVFYPQDGKLKHSSSDFAYGIDKIRFKTPLVIGKQIVTDFRIDIDTEDIYIPKTANERINLSGAKMPIVPLHYLLGEELPPIVSIPSPNVIKKLPGWSNSFFNTWQTATSNLLNSNMKSILVTMAFEMDMKNNRLFLGMYVAMNNQYYKGVFPMSFKKSASGEFEFSALPFEDANPNHQFAKTLQPYCQPLLDVVLKNKFKIDYYDFNGSIIGQFISTNKPDVFFTGEFRSYFN